MYIMYNKHLCDSVQSDVAVNKAAGGVYVCIYIHYCMCMYIFIFICIYEYIYTHDICAYIYTNMYTHNNKYAPAQQCAVRCRSGPGGKRSACAPGRA